MSSEREIIPGMLKTAAGTLASRVLGLARDVITAGMFGTGAAMDMFVIAFTVPNLFRRLFGEGAMNASFVPEFTREDSAGGDPRRLLNAVMTSLAALLLGITVIGWVACGGVLFFGPQTEKARLFCLLLMILLPYMPLICLSAVQAAALNVRGHFLRPALAPTFMNLCWIGAALLFGRRYGISAVAVGIIVSGALQFLWQARMLRGERLTFRPVWALMHPGLRRIGALMLPAALGVGVIQLNAVADKVIAQFCVPGNGANSALYYGMRLMQFPLGVLGIALATAVLPTFSRRLAEGDEEGYRESVNLALRTAFFLALPCMAMLMALGVPMVRILFQRQEFTAESTMRSAAVLFYYSVGLWAFCGVQVLARGFYARQDTATPVRVAAGMVAVNLTLNLTLVWTMREAGLALASSLAGIGNLMVLYILLRRRVELRGTRSVVESGLKSGLAAAAAGASAYFVIRIPMGTGLAADVLSLGCALIVGGSVYLFLSWVVASPELGELARALRRNR
jgi:putative peptidoglycan lipid II flippase